jgi:hypothetical protein
MLFQSSDIEPPMAFNVPRSFDLSWTCTSAFFTFDIRALVSSEFQLPNRAASLPHEDAG